ncbi:MAG TPA: hypothetical protein VGM67_01475 [Gemmatimonadaceae bacterium]
MTAIAASLQAQTPPPVRQLGRIERVSSGSLASAAAALPMPGGRVVVNDITARRLLLLDSTLTSATVIADTTDATANAYGTHAGTLIRYRGDTAMYIDIGSLSMLVIGPTGKIERIMAIPRPDQAQSLIGSVFGTPGFDAHGRLIYYGGGGIGSGALRLCCLGTMPAGALGSNFGGVGDSGFVVRADLATRALDTATVIKIIKTKVAFRADERNLLTGIETTHYPFPVVDDWTVMPDGSLAVVRGRDFHVDWLGADGRWTSSPKMPFDWQPLDEVQKQAAIDSMAKDDQETLDRMAARDAGGPPGGGAAGGGRGGAGGGGRGGGGGGAPGRGRGQPIPSVVGRAASGDIADYVPPFVRGDVVADGDNNLWIKTSTVVNGQPVYDVVNRRGELFDRVQLPPFRTIAGFGLGVVYLAVKDAAGVVHLERARAK